MAERLRGVIPVQVEPWRGGIVSGLAVLGVGVLDRISHGAFSPLYTVPVVLAAIRHGWKVGLAAAVFPLDGSICLERPAAVKGALLLRGEAHP